MRLELTQAAEADLRSIFDWTEQSFGLTQAVHYQTGLNGKLAGLTEAPESGRPYPGSKPGTRRVTASRHSSVFGASGMSSASSASFINAWRKTATYGELYMEQK